MPRICEDPLRRSPVERLFFLPEPEKDIREMTTFAKLTYRHKVSEKWKHYIINIIQEDEKC